MCLFRLTFFLHQLTPFVYLSCVLISTVRTECSSLILCIPHRLCSVYEWITWWICFLLAHQCLFHSIQTIVFSQGNQETGSFRGPILFHLQYERVLPISYFQYHFLLFLLPWDFFSIFFLMFVLHHKIKKFRSLKDIVQFLIFLNLVTNTTYFAVIREQFHFKIALNVYIHFLFGNLL